MEDVGKQSELSVAELEKYKPVKFNTDDLDQDGKPVRAPNIPLSHQIVAMVSYGEEEKELIHCKSLEEMQKIHEAKKMGSALAVDWFSTAS